MVEYNAEEIPGPWRAGYSLDRHTVSSDYLGDDPYGNPVYETVRTPLGELLFRLKYRGDDSALTPIISVALEFLDQWNPPADLVVPVPPSNENRKHQPVILFAKALSAGAKIDLCDDCVAKKTPTEQLKNVHVYAERVKILRDVFGVEHGKVEDHRILLLDDLFRSGATLSALTQALYNKGAKEVYALTITRTRSRS